MFKCEQCGAVFDNPHSYWETVSYYGDEPYKLKFTECPACGDSNYEEANECKECGEYYTSDELNMDGVCFECIVKESNKDGEVK